MDLQNLRKDFKVLKINMSSSVGQRVILLWKTKNYHFVLQKTDIRDSDEKVVEIEMERLRTFTNHPFKVIGDSQMIELQDSIKKYGVLNPLIDRPRKEGYYEIISGHFLWSLFAVAMNEM